MEALILDLDFEAVGTLDTFESFIWTERFNRAGDFEIYVGASEEVLSMIKVDYYVYISDSDRLMIVEGIELTTDINEGNHIRIVGRSLESILDRRIVWNQTILDGYLQGQVQKLLNQNAISPNDNNRQIPGLIFETTTDTAIASMQIRSQYTGDNLYEAICEICEAFEIGFKITLDSQNRFVFKLYSGADHSYDQNANNFVIFSPNFDNLLDTSYTYDKTPYKTIGLVAGEGEGSDRKTIETGDDTLTGLDRRELFIDARDLSTNEGEISDADYYLQLIQRGDEKLAQTVEMAGFQGTMAIDISFRYGTDFSIGDIVEVENEYGVNARSRIIEFIRCQDQNGYSAYPTFEMV